MKTIYYTASSLDGFIADPENSLSWLLSRDIDEAGPMSYPAFRATIGAAALGATTYRWILEIGRAHV
jgi:dihydrofolate reductase